MSERPRRTRAASKRAAEANEETRSDDLESSERGGKGQRKAPAAKKARGGGAGAAKRGGGKGKGKAKGGDHHMGGDTQGRVLERGLIYFFYRPRVEDVAAHGPEDVQRLYIVLSPGADARHDTESGTHKKRVIIIGHKSLPEIKESGRRAMTWGFVDAVSNNLKDIHRALDSVTYQTETRGERHVAACRPCGEGVYALFDFDRHTHLAYVLELPKELGAVQDTFHIEREGSYVLSVKNPENVSANKGLGPSERAKLPPELEQAFAGRKWSKASPVELLDYPGVELLLIGVSKNVEFDLGEEGVELKEEERLDAKALSENKLFQELKMNKKEHPAQALYGQWA